MYSRYLVNQPIVRGISFDPSTTCMGVMVTDTDLTGATLPKVVYADTIFGDQVKFGIPDQFNDLHATGVLARSYGLARAAGKIIKIYEPDVAICEDSFLGMSPDTFKQLVKTVGMLREECNKASKTLYMNYVLPNLAKAIVGANFKGTQKEDVRKGLLAYKNLDWGSIDPTILDEHSVDAGVINLYLVEQLLRDYTLRKEAA